MHNFMISPFFRDGVCILSCTGTAVCLLDSAWAKGHHIHSMHHHFSRLDNEAERRLSPEAACSENGKETDKLVQHVK